MGRAVLLLPLTECRSFCLLTTLVAPVELLLLSLREAAETLDDVPLLVTEDVGAGTFVDVDDRVTRKDVGATVSDFGRERGSTVGLLECSSVDLHGVGGEFPDDLLLVGEDDAEEAVWAFLGLLLLGKEGETFAADGLTHGRGDREGVDTKTKLSVIVTTNSLSVGLGFSLGIENPVRLKILFVSPRLPLSSFHLWVLLHLEGIRHPGHVKGSLLRLRLLVELPRHPLCRPRDHLVVELTGPGFVDGDAGFGGAGDGVLRYRPLCLRQLVGRSFQHGILGGVLDHLRLLSGEPVPHPMHTILDELVLFLESVAPCIVTLTFKTTSASMDVLQLPL
jgi:hypothetical protein